MPAQLGVTIPFAGVGTRAGIDLVRRAADWGYRACWAAEINGPDAFTQLAVLAATTDLDLGVAVVPVQTRTPMVLGMTAIALAEISGGRFALGVGASSEVIAGRWAGQPFDAPLTHVRETVEALRPLLAGERVSYEGRFVRMQGYRPHTTLPAPVPLYVGALNPRSLKLVGELGADGLCLNQMAPHHVPQMLDLVRAGAGGSLPEDFGVVARLFCLVTDDVAGGRELVKHVFAPYIATTVYNRFYRWMGYEAEAQGVLDAAGDRARMSAAVSDRLVDDLVCIGDADAVTARLKEFVASGVTVPVVAPLVSDLRAAESTLRAIAERW